MSIFENKRAVALTSLFAVGFVGFLAWGISSKSALDATLAEITAQEETQRSLQNRVLSPSEETIQALNKQRKAIKDKTAILQKDIQPYITTCSELSKDAINKNERFRPAFLESARNWLNKKKGESAIQIPDGNSFTFGMDKDYNEKEDAANTENTPYVIYQLNAARTLAGYVVESGAASLDRMYCEPVPQEKVEEGNVSMHIELSFTAKRPNTPYLLPETLEKIKQAANEAERAKLQNVSALSNVVNAIIEGNGDALTTQKLKTPGKYFFIIRGFRITGTNVCEANDPIEPPVANAGEAEKENDAPIAKRRVGSPEDTVTVDLIVEAVYFPRNSK